MNGSSLLKQRLFHSLTVLGIGALLPFQCISSPVRAEGVTQNDPQVLEGNGKDAYLEAGNRRKRVKRSNKTREKKKRQAKIDELVREHYPQKEDQEKA